MEKLKQACQQMSKELNDVGAMCTALSEMLGKNNAGMELNLSEYGTVGLRILLQRMADSAFAASVFGEN